MPDIVFPYAHRTHRLTSQQKQVAFALGGEAGARLLQDMSMAISPDTLLRLIRNAPETDVLTPRVLGVDDWAKRKGQSYGTILVDLEAQRPVDILPDRSAASFEAWLKAHPGVEIISRDRGTEYIKGATDGAPEAIQVADCWHLLKNLRDSLERLLENKRACLKAAADKSNHDVLKQDNPSSNYVEQIENSTLLVMTFEELSEAFPKLRRTEKQKLLRRVKSQERYEAVKELYKQGFSQSEIIHHLNIDRKTVSKYIKADECPLYPEDCIRSSKLDPYKEYITQRWQSGYHSATQILHEIRKQGFKGSRSIMMNWVSQTLKPLRASRYQSSFKRVVPEKIVHWTPCYASCVFIKQEDELTDEEKQSFERIKQADDKVSESYTLGQRFVRMIRKRQPEALLPWLDNVVESGIEVLKQFARGIKQDIAAVK